jgi:hypothetical protein
MRQSDLAFVDVMGESKWLGIVSRRKCAAQIAAELYATQCSLNEDSQNCPFAVP